MLTLPVARLAGLMGLSLAVAVAAPAKRTGGDFEEFVKPLFQARCVECHSGDRPKGGIDLGAIATEEQLLAQPELIEQILDMVDSGEMPPEEKDGLGHEERARLVAFLGTMLREATAGVMPQRLPIRRLNRFEYSNSVRDLFKLDRDVFRLPEKLMTRYGDYVSRGAGRMPDRVDVACNSMRAEGGMNGVYAYPKDLRAAHGFDNQANQLTLSPLLLDAFLRLSASIVDSPDFHEKTVGVWGELFAAPAAGTDLPAELRRRLQPFLTRAFRRPVDEEVLERYTAFGLAQLEQGAPFADAIKRVAAGALSSPLFLYRYGVNEHDPFALASNLSSFLWGSLPSPELLELAASGELTQPEVLRRIVDEMLKDPRIERFLDVFPAQWMQLENVLAATPDPALYRAFRIDGGSPASLHMVLEPLLLFDAVFVEDRPIVELITPDFGYESRFLATWYRSELRPEPLDLEAVDAENAARAVRVAELETALDGLRAEGKVLAAVLSERIDVALETVDLAPGQVAWEEEQTRVLAINVVLSTWHRIGPFLAGNFDQAHAKEFVDAASIDLEEVHGELRWTEAPEFVDGTGHQLTGSSCATYLRRTIHADSARPLDVSLGSDDSFKIWLGGELVAERKVTRGLAPDQDQVRLELAAGENELLLKIVNGGGGYGFHFQPRTSTLPVPVKTAMQVDPATRNEAERDAIAAHYYTVATELAPLREAHAKEMATWRARLATAEKELKTTARPQTHEQLRAEAQRRYDDQLRAQLRSRTFERVAVSDPRYGGVITNAAMLSMTSGPKRTLPIARGAWVVEVILNDPPEPPPNDVPPLREDVDPNLTIRERFAQHRNNPSCAGCHARLDPLGFALENFDITGRWRDVYANGRTVDASGSLLRGPKYAGIVEFKASLAREERRFATAFTGHLLRFALARELGPADRVTIEAIVTKTEADHFRLRSILREVAVSQSVRRAK